MVEQPTTLLSLDQSELDLLAGALAVAQREARIAVSMVLVANELKRKLDAKRTDRLLASRRGDTTPPATIRCVEYEVQTIVALLSEHHHTEELARKVIDAAEDLSTQRRRRAANRVLHQAAGPVVQQPTDPTILKRLMLHEAKVGDEKD